MKKLIDLTGKRFGRLVVLSESSKSNTGLRRWVCKCDCGTVKIIHASSLTRGLSTSCGCYNRQRTREIKFIDLTGKIFGRLKVIRLSSKTEYGKYIWECLCECGNTINVLGDNLKKGQISCGCYKTEYLKESRTIHGLSKTKLYSVWNSMKDRCYREGCEMYKYYGGRGIIVCDEWRKNYKEFYDWAMSSGYTAGLSIDRIDNNGNYEPVNCRWVTAEQQANNTRANRYITVNGITKTLSQWVKLLRIDYSTFYRRKDRGFDDVMALGGIAWIEQRILSNSVA